MLELYHGGHTTCSRKARLCLKEKGLAYTSHFLNLRGFEQHTPAYLKLNPNGVVPTLVDDGEAIVDSMLINEYLDEKYDQHTRLRPSNPLDKARMRVWTKLASDHGLSAWCRASGRPSRRTPTSSTRMNSRRSSAASRSRNARNAGPRSRAAVSANRISTPAARRRSLIVTRMEAGLGAGPWLMGEQYTLADIDLIPFVDRFAEFYPDMLNASATPKVMAWLARMRERPAVKAVWATDEAPAKAA